MNIRYAKMEDKERFVELGEQMYQESIFNDMNWNPEKVGKLIDYSLQEDPFFFVAVVEDEIGIHGFMGACCYPSFFGDDKQAADLALYITPEKRGLKHAIGLIKLYEEWATAQNAVACTLGNSAGIVDKSYMKLLMKLGYEEAGFSGRKKLKLLQPA